MIDLWHPTGKPFVIDLSHNNNFADRHRPIDFHALYADGVRKVIHKASQGTAFIDPCYHARRKQAVDAGLIWDAYHFCTADPVKAQLDYFLAVAELDDKMRGALDCEPNKGSTIGFAGADVFALSLDGKRGTQCLRYTGGGFFPAPGPLLQNAIARAANFRKGPIWWAKYGPMPTAAQLGQFGIDPLRVVLWQCTGNGTRPGISGPVDESWWLGTEDELKAYPTLPAAYPKAA